MLDQAALGTVRVVNSLQFAVMVSFSKKITHECIAEE